MTTQAKIRCMSARSRLQEAGIAATISLSPYALANGLSTLPLNAKSPKPLILCYLLSMGQCRLILSRLHDYLVFSTKVLYMFFLFLPPSQWPSPRFDSLRGFGRAVEEFRAVDGAMTMNTASAFLRVSTALNEISDGTTSLRKIAGDMEMPAGSMLRHVAALSDGGPGLKSLGLLERGIHARDRRERVVRLTPRGLALIENVAKHLEVQD